ncbi:MAG: polysaccharide pyruvyl transferase family protein [Victivallaceae bacterium]|nr:polysaccharide pyruvyl transferase family protein [Victivallaceae bacterium]
MNSTLKKILRPPYRFIKKCIRYLYIRKQTARLSQISRGGKQYKIFYLGIVEHSNLGDLAQYYCIKRWIRSNYPDIDVIEFETSTVVDDRFGFIDKLRKVLMDDDIIFFQSGYTTQDLGGNHDLMHRIIIDNFPQTQIVMMPQTIFFQSHERRQLTAESYNQAKHLLFLARDRISYEEALRMFPDITVKLFPDIVTTLIGHYYYDYQRDGILFCCRNDSEKFYSDGQIIDLRKQLDKLMPTDMTDTSLPVKHKTICRDLQHYIEAEIERYAHYKLIITDRYHGTIFSLIANTPVIVIKTTDHKVTTGVEWFRGIYDDNVFLAESLEQVYDLAKSILSKEYSYRLKPFYEEKYYNKLKSLVNGTNDQ